MRIEESRCLVLGAGGFLGTNLCNSLYGRAKAVKGFGRRGLFRCDAAVEWVGEEFLDGAQLQAAVEHCDVVFHLLGTTTPSSADADKLADLSHNVGGTLQLLEFCRQAGVRRVIFVSSGGTVYGRPTIVPTPESALPQPISAYGISKLSIERYLALYEHCYGLEQRVLRVANPYGPYQWAQRNQGAIAMFMRRALAHRPVHIWGDGSTVRDYLYVEDVVSALIASIAHEGPSRVFNIGSGVGRSLIEIVAAIERVSGVPLPIEFENDRPIDVPTNVLDIGLAATEMGWAPTTPFVEGLQRTWDWLRGAQAQLSEDLPRHV
ncbi:NAD-dependent epimerase/dehydratase family protein [Bordetella bronchialis]|uniref:NAD-dependent epimerase/dehydratase domain-containing protein n=1 Tax=Bordetella bronchialis TaxID=463025 RepID=A0A193FPR8_9BORD|nr:NAD-dependent epimerase/dehydratase family protein [Bordetella bronchialis]ANN69089.1 hypothetical protein BAU06_24765 [Bordetella bronchialis]ANN74237.1 hypothetical protein BAU08_25340 [Bordetella bronchialis]